MRGITVFLHERVQTGIDAFKRPVFDTVEIPVENVLVSPVSDEEAVEEMNLTGRRAVYKLAIPKGDAREWVNKKVTFFGQDFKVIGTPTQGIEHLIPLSWNKIVKVEAFENGEGSH